MIIRMMSIDTFNIFTRMKSVNFIKYFVFLLKFSIFIVK